MAEQRNKRVGRPKKAEVEAKKKGNRVALGRPKGDAAAIAEYKARLLASPKSRKVMDSIFNAALDDDHKNQSAAWKLLFDRLAPLSYFEKDKLSGGKSSINITISNTHEKGVEIQGEEIEDADFEEDDDAV